MLHSISNDGVFNDRSSLVIRHEPGAIEHLLVVIALFVSQFGTPTDWFTARATVGFGGATSNPLLVFGLLATVGVLSLGLVGNGEAVVRSLRLEPLLVVFILLVALSTLWSENLGQGLSDAANFFVATLLGYILFIRYRLQEAIGLASLGIVVGLAMNLFWVFALPGLGQLHGSWLGITANKNFLGAQAVQSLPFMVLAARAFPRWRFVFYPIAVVAGALAVGSQSKTSLAAGLLTMIAAAVYTAFRARKTLYGAVVITLSATSVAAALFATANIGLLAQWLEKDATLTGRTEMWPIIISDILDRPWLGYGYGGYWGGYLSPSHEVWVSQRWFPTHSHNALLEVAIRVGLIGLLVFTIVNARGIARATVMIREVRGPLGLLPLVFFTLLLMASITESGVLPQRFGWTMYVFFILTVARQQECSRQELPELDRPDVDLVTPRRSEEVPVGSQ